MVTLGAPPLHASVRYGHQIPELLPSELTRLNDVDSTKGLVAYYFHATYNHAVLLNEDDFALAETTRSEFFMRQTTYQPGESLWQCLFNDALLEGYIYVDQPTTPEITSNGTTINNTTTTPDIPKLPYLIKLIEKRMPNGKEPYCEKVVLEQNNIISQRSDKIALSLSEPASEPVGLKSTSVRSKVFQQKGQEEPYRNCGCQWLIR